MIDPQALDKFHALMGRVETFVSFHSETIANAKRADATARAEYLHLPNWRKRLTRRPRATDVRANILALEMWTDAQTVFAIIMPLIDAHLGLDRPLSRAAAPQVQDIGLSLELARTIAKRAASLCFPLRFNYDFA